MPEDTEHKEPEHKEADKGHESSKEPHKEKSNHLLWWGLGIGAVGLLVTLYLASRNSGGGTTVQASQPFTPNPTDVSQGLTSTNTPIPSQYQTPNNAPSEDYWPSVPTNNNGQTQSGTTGSGDDDNTSSSSNNGNSNQGNGNTGGGSNQQQNSGPPPVQLPSHNAYVYTTRPGETLNTLTNKFNWSPDKQTGGGPSFTYNYGNNAAIFSSLGISPNNPNQVIPTGTQIAG